MTALVGLVFLIVGFAVLAVSDRWPPATLRAATVYSVLVAPTVFVGVALLAHEMVVSL